MTPANKPTDPPKPTPCQGAYCRQTHDVRFDHTSRKHLCLDCWAKVNPAAYGFKRS